SASVSTTKDTIAPTISSVTASADENYVTTNVITLTTNFSESVNLVAGPLINVTIGTNTRAHNCAAGNGISSSNCTYTVSNPDADQDGIVVSSPLSLGAGSIADLAGNPLSVLTFTPPDTSGIYANGVSNPIFRYQG